MQAELTSHLYYKGLMFYFIGISEDGERVYKSLDELHHLTIITTLTSLDGALIAKVDDVFKTSDDDDLIRLFDSRNGQPVIK